MSEEDEQTPVSTRYQRFKLLLWKSYLWHRFHYWWSIIEIIARCLIPLYLGLAVPNDIKLKSHPVTYTTPRSRMELLSTFRSYEYLAYAPSTSFTDKLMNNVIKALEIELKNTKRMELVKMLNERDLEEHILNFSITLKQLPIAIVFLELSSEHTIPSKLVYKLRHGKAIDTNWLLPKFSIVGKCENESEYWTGGFSAIQLLVNEEFIKIKSNNVSWITPEPMFQQFPYPEYETSEINRQDLLHFICSAIICIEIALCIPFIASVIFEKRSGAKELMKVYGVEESLIWLNWFVIEFVIIFISVTLVTTFLKIPFKGHATESSRHVEFLVLWAFLMLFGISNITLTLFICAIFNRATIAALVYVFMNFFSVILIYVTNLLNMRRISVLICVIPAANMLKGVPFMLDAENHAVAFNWLAVKTSRDNESNVKAYVHFTIFILDFIIYLMLALYIGSNNHNEFGTGLRKFLIFRSFDRRIRNKESVTAESLHKVNEPKDCELSLKTAESLITASNLSETNDDDDDFAPINPELTIQIENLSTKYGSMHGLNGLNVQFYDHEVGVVLGHNGAGKTTLLAVLAGIHSYDHGSIHYKGSNIYDDANILKSHVGICFKENRLFNYVSVLNHLVFYGMLKGLSKSSATDEAEHYLLKMEMQNDKNSKISSLSESTKRKLSIANSFMGDRQVLLLDEPMIGLDSDARTATWNFLMGLRTDHTIIITSNYEKDAERLADRITVLENGGVVAHGTPNSLRKNIGINYEIAIAGKEVDFAAVTETMRQNVYVSSQNEGSAEIIYEVPIKESSKFVDLFEILENDDLKISEINVTSNTIEYALMKLKNSSTDRSFKLPNTSEILVSGHDLSHFIQTSGFLVKVQQMKVLLRKRFHYIIRDYKNITSRIILPTLIALLFILIIEYLNFDPFVPMKMSLSTYINPSIMLLSTNWSHQMNKSVTNYMNSEHVTHVFSGNSNLIESLIDFGRKDVMRFRRELIAAFEFEANKSHCIWYNLWTLHSLPIAITAYSNILLRNITTDESSEIIAYNHPIPVAKIGCETNELWIQVFTVSAVLFIMFGYFTIEVVLYLFEFSSKEIANSLMHLQIMSGVPVWIYWFATIVFDLIFFIIVIAIRIALFTFIDNHHKFFSYDSNFVVFLLLILIFGITGLFYAYVISFLYKPTNRTYAHLFEFNFFCNLIVAMSYALTFYPGDRKETQGRNTLSTYIFMWFPSLNFPWAVTQYLTQWYNNNKCSLTCSPRLKSWCRIENTTFKSAIKVSTYENPYGILLELIFLTINLIISGMIFILINFGFVDFMHNYFKRKETPDRNYDDDVKHEYKKIHLVKEDLRHGQVPLLVDGLSKSYIKRLKPITCVEDVSFMAEHGTCFGILKGYDAGKTTVFDMMTAKTVPTKGNVSVEGVEMRTNRREYFSMIGYCPRTSPLLDKFTGEEMLLLIASLNESRSDIKNLVSEWISASGLDELQHVKCERYTDGSKRLLSTVLALISQPKVVFLDEPTSEIDSQTRRHLYDIIEQLKYSRRTVVFGSTSAIECYSLCDRLTILKNGVMQCLGHPHDLRKHYDLGYFIVIKVQSDIMSMRKVRYLEDYMIQVFGPYGSHLIEHYRILEDSKDNSAWNREASEEENQEGSWYRFLSAARGMLHQYAGQQYSSINGHYSPLNSCSQLVQQTYSQASKITEINDCDSEQSGYFNEEKFSPNESEESQTQRFEAKELSQSCESSKELVPNIAESYERTVQDKCDNETSQMINDEQNNNVQKSQIKSEPFNYQKYTAASEETDIIPYIDLDMETIINAPVNENEEYKQKLQSTANEINKICDENESNFRLPGFHQAFGSTEIGRYVHQKDFIEQTATQSIIMHQSKTMMLQCQTTVNGVPNGLSSPKAKSRVCSKRIKTPMETNTTRLAPCWNYEHETDSPAAVCTPPNGGYYKRKDMRRGAKPNQNCENGSSVGGYYGADEYYNNCPSPYYGGCSDYPNCEYYRYQQNPHSHSPYYNSNNNNNNNNNNSNGSSYNTHSNNYNMNNYTEEHSQRLSSYGSASSMAYSHNQNWRGERFFPYAEQFQSYRYRQGSSSPYYQQFVSSNQHIQSQQSFNYGYNSYPPVPNYNYF